MNNICYSYYITLQSVVQFCAYAVHSCIAVSTQISEKESQLS